MLNSNRWSIHFELLADLRGTHKNDFILEFLSKILVGSWPIAGHLTLAGPYDLICTCNKKCDWLWWGNQGPINLVTLTVIGPADATRTIREVVYHPNLIVGTRIPSFASNLWALCISYFDGLKFERHVFMVTNVQLLFKNVLRWFPVYRLLAFPG